MNYLKDMRKLIGHETLLTVGCGIILVKEQGILLQHRIDEDNWCIPGGVMELGETFEQTATRETYEETGLKINSLDLFGIYSGASCFVEYPNKDRCYSVQIIFQSSDFDGELIQEGIESKEHRFFRKDNLPDNLNPRQRQFIEDWAKGRKTPIIS